MPSTRDKLPRTQTQRIIFQVRYRPELSFYDRLFSSASELSEYGEWRTDKLKVILFDYEGRCSLAIAHDNFGFETDLPDTDDWRNRVRLALDKLPDSLNIDSFTRIGLRHQGFIPAEMAFEELTEILRLKLFSPEQELAEVLPNQISDLIFRVVGSEDGSQYGVTFGPVTRSEIPRYINVNQDLHFSPDRREQEYLALIDGYPETAIFYDIDIYRQDEIPVDEGPAFLEDAVKRFSDMVEGFRDYVYAKKIKG